MPVISGQAVGEAAELSRSPMPAIYAAQLVQLAGRWGITPQRMLEGTGLAAEDLEHPEGRVPALATAIIADRALRLTNEPGLGFYFGLHLKLPSHGDVGLAAMASATLRDAVAVAERYVGLRTPHLTFRHYVEGELAVIELVDILPGGLLRPFVTEALFTALAQMGRSVLGRVVHATFEMAFKEPAYFQGFLHLLPGPVRFSQPANRVLFAASMLDESLQMSDPLASRHALSRCEAELALLGETSTLLASVRRQLREACDGTLSLEALARMRHVSARTLKRKLAAHGTSFQQLLDEQRRDRAVTLLDDPNLSVARIAGLLGYSDASNFNRAFRRWVGVSPSAFRTSHLRK